MTPPGPLCVSQLSRETCRDVREKARRAGACQSWARALRVSRATLPEGAALWPHTHILEELRAKTENKHASSATSDLEQIIRQNAQAPRPALSAKLCFSVTRLDEPVVPADRCLCRGRADQAPRAGRDPHFAGHGGDSPVSRAQ